MHGRSIFPLRSQAYCWPAPPALRLDNGCVPRRTIRHEGKGENQGARRPRPVGRRRVPPVDLVHVDLTTAVPLRRRSRASPTVVIAKHLCGAGTNLALKSLRISSASRSSPCRRAGPPLPRCGTARERLRRGPRRATRWASTRPAPRKTAARGVPTPLPSPNSWGCLAEAAGWAAPYSTSSTSDAATTYGITCVPPMPLDSATT